MIVDDSIFPLHECYNDKTLCYFDASKTRPFYKCHILRIVALKMH